MPVSHAEDTRIQSFVPTETDVQDYRTAGVDGARMVGLFVERIRTRLHPPGAPRCSAPGGFVGSCRLRASLTTPCCGRHAMWWAPSWKLWLRPMASHMTWHRSSGDVVNDRDHQCADLSYFSITSPPASLSPEAMACSGRKGIVRRLPGKAVAPCSEVNGPRCGFLCPCRYDLGRLLCGSGGSRPPRRRKAGGGRDAILARPDSGSIAMASALSPHSRNARHHGRQHSSTRDEPADRGPPAQAPPSSYGLWSESLKAGGIPLHAQWPHQPWGGVLGNLPRLLAGGVHAPHRSRQL